MKRRANIDRVLAIVAVLVLIALGMTGARAADATEPALYTGHCEEAIPLRAGVYDIKLKLKTGEIQWKRGVTLKGSDPLVLHEQFPARNLILTANDPNLNLRAAGCLTGIFKQGDKEPIGWFRVGTGTALPPGTYDLLIAASNLAREGIWRRGVTIAAEPVKIEMGLKVGFIGVQVLPALPGLDGRSALQVTVRKAGTDSVIATLRAGEQAAIPPGHYDLRITHDGLYGKIDREFKAVEVTSGFSTTRLLSLVDTLGGVRFHAFGAGGWYEGVQPRVTVLRDGTPVARHDAASEIALAEGRYSFSLEFPPQVTAKPMVVAEVEAYRLGTQRTVDAPVSVGQLLAATGDRLLKIRLTPDGKPNEVLKEGWSNSPILALPGQYNLWIDQIGWITGITIEGSTLTIVERP